MAITYPVDVENTKWAVIQISTGEIVARNKTWPVADGGPIVGQDPDFEYLLQIATTQPDYDSRLYYLQGTETVDVPENELRTTWAAVARSSDERKTAAENEENNRMSEFVRMERFQIEAALMVGVLIHVAIKNQQMPPKMVTFGQEYYDKCVKLWNNRDRLQEIFADIDSGIEPDLDLWPE